MVVTLKGLLHVHFVSRATGGPWLFDFHRRCGRSCLGAGPAPAAEDSEEIVVTGTRVANRSRLDTVAPVDVLSAETLENLGTTELNQALAVSLPSLNFPRPALSDGTDTVRPATLRGLAPDQALVLVNSKRRHSAALVNVNGTIGRGSAAVDMNTIPGAIINRVEVLRDGASAQYGSDAISGVINIRLKEESSGGGATVTYGQRFTDVEVNPAASPLGATWAVNPKREARDGKTITVSGWQGLSLGEGGFLTVAGEYRDQEKTVRAGVDTRQQYPLVGTAFDPREASFNRINGWYGDPELDQLTFFANAGKELGGGAELYGWASYQKRNALAAGFYRRAVQERVPPAAGSQNIISIYPNGFLPKIDTDTTDISAGGGLSFQLAGWDGDASIVYGSNDLSFGVVDTLNVTLGPSNSQRTFDAGSLFYDQIVGNISFVRGLDIGAASPLNVAVGLEARQEGYQIEAGEVNSYVDGGWRLNQTTLTWANVGTGTPPAGFVPAVPGAQVFPGFRPSNALDEDRTAVGGYIDLEVNLTDKLLVSGAIRGESYSDFGETFNYKLAGRYDFTDAFAVRGAVQTGFRAPSLQQQFFSATATNFVAGVPFQIITVPAGGALAANFGAKALDAEESENYSLGAVLRSGPFSLTVDGYFIKIDDRVTLSENIFPTGALLALLPAGTSGIRFFINGVDTETTGAEIVGRYEVETDNIGEFDFTVSANFVNQQITRAPAASLFGRVARLTLLDGQPKEKVTFTTDWEKGPFAATFRGTYYGQVVEPAAAAANDIPLGQKTLFDIEGRFSLNENVSLALGAENILDTYPDATAGALNGTGGVPFSRYSPFGFNGRYLYGRMSVNW
jgi:iron complex outermembrane receptor protein